YDSSTLPASSSGLYSRLHSIPLSATIPPPPRSTLFPYTTLFRSTLFPAEPLFRSSNGNHNELNQDDARYGFRCCHLKNIWTAPLDRKSGSAGMPRPISYAVFCLK